MTDSDRKREKYIAFVLGFIESISSALYAEREARHRDLLDVIRASFWYSDIERRLGSCSIYRVERILEPEAFRDKESPYHLNKWRRYRIGANTPRAALVEQVDKKLPGSAALLNHPLWEAIRGKKPVKRLLKEEIQRLVPAIQQIVFDSDEFGLVPSKLIWPVSRVRLHKIERRAGIDALACLTILLRVAIEEKDKKQAFDVSVSLYRVLLITCASIFKKPWANAIFAIYCISIFPMVDTDERQFDFDNFNLDEAILRLKAWTFLMEDDGIIGDSYKDNVVAMQKILTACYGYNLWRFFAPPIRGKNGKMVGELLDEVYTIKASTVVNENQNR